MKLFAILGLTLLTASAPGPDYVVVTDSPGGQIDEFVERLHEWERKGLTIHIAGECYSACTMYTGAKRVCLEPNATLWFHQGYELAPEEYRRLGQPIRTKGYATAMMLSYMDQDLRKWIEETSYPLPSYESGEYVGIDAAEIIAKGMMQGC